MNEEHFSKLERMYLGANVNTRHFPTTEIKIEDKSAEISIQVDDSYFHALGALHGSVYFKLLDDSAFFAVSSIVKDFFVLTTSFHINMVRPVTEGKLTAVGKVSFAAQNHFVAESRIFNEKGKEVGFGTGTFSKSKIQLSPDIGYI